ncbi:sporulation histidine kinase inhibitor Sda [Aquibacillus kalidii]|nr:sporulation histidine kinase inhibitor Sda [Aquibacillus kalidii]
MYHLSYDQLIDAYKRSVDLNLDRKFIILLEQEIEFRRTGIKVI